MSDRNNFPRANPMWDSFEDSQKYSWHNGSTFPGYEHLHDPRHTADSYQVMFANQSHLVLGSQDSLHNPNYDSSQEKINVMGTPFSLVKTEQSSPRLDDMLYLTNSPVPSLLSHDLDHSPRIIRQAHPAITVPPVSESKLVSDENQRGGFKSPLSEAPKLPLQRSLGMYPDVTTMVNSDSTVVAPMVESTFVDHTICNICKKRFTRDMNRHQGIHQEHKRFNCVYPKDFCKHRTGLFNRRYDFKKHLLNKHFVFDSKSIKRTPSLKDKSKHWGTCTCGRRFQGQDWIDNHVLTQNEDEKCPHLKLLHEEAQQ